MLKEFKNNHTRQKCYVLATGNSLIVNLHQIDRNICKIGVNTIGKYIIPNYLIVLDRLHFHYPKNKDIEDRYREILTTHTHSGIAFTPHEQEFKNVEQVIFKYGNFHDVSTLSNNLKHNILFHCQTTTTTAISLAIYMGFTSIGVLGFDLIGHALYKQREYINTHCEIINEYCKQESIEIFNLSDNTEIKAFPMLSLESFNK